MNTSEPININDASFERAVLQSPVPVIVDFWAEWCGPCKMLTPVLNEIAKEHGDKVRVTKVNVDENPELATRYGVRSIPTLLFFANGKLESTSVGVQSKSKLLEHALSLSA